MSDIDEERFDEDFEDTASESELAEADQEDSDAVAADEGAGLDEAADGEDADEDEGAADDEEAAEDEAARPGSDDSLFDKANKAARLLRARKAALRDEAEERGGKPSLLVRAIGLLSLKPKMEQKEMADLLGCRLRELDAVLAEAEKQDIVARVEPDEPDMRKVVVIAADDAMELAEAAEKKEERLVPGLSDEDAVALDALLDKVIDPLVALGLDEDRGEKRPFRGGRDDRRGNDRDRRGGFGGRGRDDRRGGFGGRGGHDDRRGGYRDHDDRGGRGRDDHRGGYRGGSDRGGYGNGGGRGGYGRDDHRGGYRGGSDRGGYRGDDRRSGGYRGRGDRS